MGILIVPAILAPIWYLFHSQRPETKPLGRPPAPAASVVVVTTERRDVPVALKGIGIVQAYNTVTVKPRISGQIMQVVFTEGQQVHQNDVLASIDSRFLIAHCTRLRPHAPRTTRNWSTRKGTGRAQVATLEAAVKADEAAIENTQVQLDYATVTAPIEGMTGIRMVDVGNVRCLMRMCRRSPWIELAPSA
jgi:multidrug efflux system membrane fusion protein